MGIVVVGGQARKVGKTSLVAGIVAALPDRRWTAVKVTQCHHAGAECHCGLGGAEFAMTEEKERDASRDSSRYLAAGAVRAFWVRVKPGAFGAVMLWLRELIAQSGDVVIESNGVVEYVKPAIFVCVLAMAGGEEKAGWADVFARADATAGWSGCSGFAGKTPYFAMGAGCACSGELAGFIEERLGGSSGGESGLSGFLGFHPRLV